MTMHSGTFEWPCFRARRSGRRLGVVAAAAALEALAMAARGRGRHGPPFGPARGFGPFFYGRPGGFRRGPRARRGDVRAAALLLLAEGPLNGYQIMQEIERRSDGVWRPSPGSVYPALAQLEDEGLVHADEVADRRTYVLTEAGRVYVDERRGELGAPWEQMTDSVDDDVASLFREVRHVGMATWQVVQLGNPGQAAKARGILADARKALYALLAADEGDE